MKNIRSNVDVDFLGHCCTHIYALYQIKRHTHIYLLMELRVLLVNSKKKNTNTKKDTTHDNAALHMDVGDDKGTW